MTSLDLSQSVRTFFTEHHFSHLDSTTASDYTTQLNHYEKYFAESLTKQAAPARLPALNDFSIGHVHGAMNWQLDRRRSKPTADKVRRTLLAIWNKAAELSNGELRPPGRMRSLKKPEYEPVAWTLEEFGQLLNGAMQLEGNVGPFPMGPWLSALLWTVYNSGLRISSTMAIRRTWVNVIDRRLVVDPAAQKDDEGRSVGLLPETLKALLPLLANGKDGPFDDWPFDQNVVQWPALTLRLRQAIVAAKLADSIDQITRRDLWHKIRRTFATQIFKATGNIEDVRRRLGHSSIAVTYRYIDFSQLGHKSEIELLPRPTARQLQLFAS